jgi:flagellar biosynthesis/type III secretory pathway protein FliH
MAQAAMSLTTSRPIATVKIATDLKSLPRKPKPVVDGEALKPEKEKLARAGEGLSKAAAELQRLQEELLGSHREPIVRLSIGIAEKILMKQIDMGQYDISRIIGEAMSIVPAQDQIVVRLNPIDLEIYDKSLQETGKTRPNHVTLKPDSNIDRAECVVESEQGLIEYRIAEHLRQIEEAMLRNQPE